MRPAALADPLCGSLCDLCGECFSEQFHHRGTENHRVCTEKSLTQLAPINFFSNLPDLLHCHQEFRVQNRRSRRAANRVMTQSYKSIIKHVVRCNAADGHTHSISSIAIETWLWPIILVSNNDWLFRS